MDEFPDLPTDSQWRQQTAGDLIAITTMLRALIAAHPNQQAPAMAMNEAERLTAPLFLHREFLQREDGMRASYSAAMREFHSAMLGS